ncbi:hypothetical protein F383_32733 [Gossypium arboreum]|uniref:Uncharacterized protein n=1 Tax=Gossypium arboreum TaxID=29729 RepID=A0A0B0MZU7_GOSAR|nr:hypothetical protein F383_32733 [Gossypium arboreum]
MMNPASEMDQSASLE